MIVLITNDDGITSAGLRALYFALKKAGHEVFAAAPMRQQSGVGHALTYFEPVRSKEIRDGDFTGAGIFGTPTDCVKLALGALMSRAPDLVISGINEGRNVGPDIIYSGTVAAAAEAAQANLPSLALSHDLHGACAEINEIAEHAVKLAEKINWSEIGPNRVVNVNYPNMPIAAALGPRVCPMSKAVWKNIYKERADPRGNPYWWLEGAFDESGVNEDSDMELLNRGYITITSLKYDHSDPETHAALMRIFK